MLTPESLLALDEAVEALPCGPEARAWLLKNVEPAGVVAGMPVWKWGTVLEAIGTARRPVAEPEAKPPLAPKDHPITRWKDAAAVLGLSEDTLSRRRHERDRERVCYFDTANELRAWWRGLIAPEPVAQSPRRKVARATPARGTMQDGPVDWKAFGKSLTGK